jgi:plasmid maintenance system killer protein
MGLENREAGNFITIYDGKFSQRVEKGEEGAVERVNKLKKTVYEKYHDSLTGKLVSIKVKDGEYGKQWVFGFQDTKDVYLLQLPFSNSFSKNILKMLPNADLTKEMRLTPSSKVEADGTKKYSIFINQDGQALKHAYTKDNPNGLPPMTQVTVKGSLVWDDTDQMIWLEKMVNDTIVPKLGGAVAPTATAPVDSLDKFVGDLNAGVDINPEDIPF